MKLLLAVAMLVAFAWSAVAGFEFQQNRPITGEILGCDTLEQAQTIVGAWEENGWLGFTSARAHFSQARNLAGQPVCGAVTDIMTPVEQYSEHSVINALEQAMTVYLILFSWGGVDLYTISPFPMVDGVSV